jgi:hypothetical protein
VRSRNAALVLLFASLVACSSSSVTATPEPTGTPDPSQALLQRASQFLYAVQRKDLAAAQALTCPQKADDLESLLAGALDISRISLKADLWWEEPYSLATPSEVRIEGVCEEGYFSDIGGYSIGVCGHISLLIESNMICGWDFNFEIYRKPSWLDP